MNWIVVALLSPFVYTIVNFIDKYLLSKEIQDYKALPIYTALVGFIFGSLFWFIVGRPIMPLRDSLIVITTGILTSWSLVVYFKALSLEETSRIILLFQFTPIFTLVLASILLKETIGFNQLLGFVLIMMASVLVVVRKEKKRFKLTKALFYMIIYDLLWAGAGVLMKYALNVNSFSRILSYESWGVGIGGLIVYFLMPSIRKSFNKNLKVVTIRSLSIISLNESVFVLAKALSYFAFSLGPVTLVSVLENTQVFYGIVFGAILTLLYPKIFKENVSTRNISVKLIAAFILLLGIFLLK